MENTRNNTKMKSLKNRINIILSVVFVTLLTFTSCSDPFNSGSRKNTGTTDVTLQIPAELFRAVDEDGNVIEETTTGSSKAYITVSLYVNDDDPITQNQEILETGKDVELSFRDIPVGASIWASASLLIGDNEYIGKSSTEIVKSEGTVLNLTLQLKPEPYTFAVKPTENGVELTVGNLKVDDYFQVLVETEDMCFKNAVFFGPAQTNEYTFVDVYVNSDEERTYWLRVGEAMTDPITVTTIGGLGGMQLAAETTEEGIELTVNSGLNDIIIKRSGINEDYEIWTDARISFYNAEEGFKNRKVKDLFVEPEKEYTYYISYSESDYDSYEGLTYAPISNTCELIATNGLGEFTLTNEPVAEVNQENQKFVFTTVPQFDTAVTNSDDCQVVLEFYYEGYRYSYGWDTDPVRYIVNANDNTVDISEWYNYFSDCTMTLIEGDYDQIYKICIRDLNNNTYTEIFHYDCEPVDLRGLPEEIEIPELIFKMYYDEILLYETPISTPDEFLEVIESLKNQGWTEKRDFSIGDNCIILTDSGLSKTVTESGNLGGYLVYITYDNKFLFGLERNEEYQKFLSFFTESEDYEVKSNGRFFYLTQNGYEKIDMFKDYLDEKMSSVYYGDIFIGEFYSIELTEVLGLDSEDDYTTMSTDESTVFNLTEDGLVKILNYNNAVAMVVYNNVNILYLSQSDFDSFDLSSSYYTRSSISDGKIIITLNQQGYEACSVDVDDIVSQIQNMNQSGTITVSGYISEDGILAIGSAIKTLYDTNVEIKVALDLSGVIGLNEIPERCFSGCLNLIQIELPDCIKTICFQAFCDCKITSISLEGNMQRIEDAAFFNCTLLSEINIGAGVTYIGEGAFNSQELETINVSEGNTAYKLIDGVLFTSDGTKLLIFPSKKTTDDGDYTIPAGVTRIGEFSFESVQYISEVIIPDTVVSIGSSAFSGSSITTITIPDSVRTMGYSPFISSTLETIYIGKNLTEIGAAPFRYTDNLTSITVDPDNPVYKSVDGVLYTIDGKNLISYPSSKSDTSFTIPDYVEVIEQFAFSKAQNLTDITTGNNLKIIHADAFYSCQELENITFGNSIVFIQYSAFYDCNSLETATFTDNETTWFRWVGWNPTPPEDSEQLGPMTSPIQNATMLRDDSDYNYFTIDYILQFNP